MPGDGEKVFEKRARAGAHPLLHNAKNCYIAKTYKKQQNVA